MPGAALRSCRCHSTLYLRPTLRRQLHGSRPLPLNPAQRRSWPNVPPLQENPGSNAADVSSRPSLRTLPAALRGLQRRQPSTLLSFPPWLGPAFFFEFCDGSQSRREGSDLRPKAADGIGPALG